MAITLLDGGLGQELVRRSGRPPTPLWATGVMLDRPELVQAIHADFFAAGAEIATTNTYAIHRDRLEGTGFENRFQVLHRVALDAALRARDAHGAGTIAGSIGPLGASYRSDVMPPHDEAVALFAEVAGLIAPDCDLLLIETVASLEQAGAAMAGATGHGKPVWIAFTVDDEDGARLRSGERLADALPLCGEAEALLANCSAPEAMPAALGVLAAAGKPMGAYANAFTQITKAFLENRSTVDALEARRDLGPQVYADHALGWLDQGASIVGGCCETGPAHIAELARQLGREGRAQGSDQGK
ncbi:MAG: homocysteine S-methyltransferase family protein [Gammaproteobacteria bacterium]|nr:MAG: homocysteine S-methyltransferase family protein [Gammaproteobacteria bacterium]